ncbi:MAG: hypothetical protein GWP61_18685 [Chloroflexi bacterium]|jgi:ferredoxin|nr:hypothetical protein [Chloroflexota bacterium]
MKEQDLENGSAFLAGAGLNLCAVLDCATLPAETEEVILAAGVPLADYRRLMLIGHGGRQMWSALQDWGMKTADPVDHYSTVITRQFIHDYLHNPPTFWLYPNTPYLIPLQQLGQLAGWSAPSPLGQGINPTYGVWFAYRTAFLTTLELPPRTSPPQPVPCAGCSAKPCIQACPVGAVQLDSFNIDACVKHRLRPHSPCADRCLARIACPYFPEHRYTLPQIQYHYGRSLSSLQAWNPAPFALE